MQDATDFNPAGAPQPARRGRPPGSGRKADEAPQVSERVQETRARRRRRDDLSDGRLRNLHVPDDMKDENYVYRWINDEPGRLQQMTQLDDWDVVQASEHSDKDIGVGTSLERVVDKRAGKKAILVRKPREYYEEDKAKEQEQLDRIDKELKRGVQQGNEALMRQDAAHAYVPAGGISIKTG